MIDQEFGEIALFYRRSETCAALFAALAAAQAKIEAADRDGTNPHFRSKYATLASVIEASREPLAANKLCVIQIPGNLGDNIAVTTILGHASGEWYESTLYVAPAKFDAQSIGSVITYLRRYARAAIIGIAPEDDDGEAAVARPASVPQTATKANPAVETATADKDLARRAYARLRTAVDSVITAEGAREIYDGDRWGEAYRADAALVGRISPPSLVELQRRLRQQASVAQPPEPEPVSAVPTHRRGRPRKQTAAEVLAPEEVAQLDPAPIEAPPDYEPDEAIVPTDDPEADLPPASVYVPFEASGNPMEWYSRARTRLSQMHHSEAPPDRYTSFRKANLGPLLRLKKELHSCWLELEGIIKTGEQ
jgi:hypothetical protein